MSNVIEILVDDGTWYNQVVGNSSWSYEMYCGWIASHSLGSNDEGGKGKLTPIKESEWDELASVARMPKRVRSVTIYSDLYIVGLDTSESDSGHWIEEWHNNEQWYRWSKPIIEGDYYGDGAWLTTEPSNTAECGSVQLSVHVREEDLIDAIHYLQNNMLVGQSFELFY